ncbi:hypothetical protein [Kribbella sp. DT2]|uniref:hypothetical protein n=1 Tax=Kribbella sp. DT2 TaxID=3393427 RepID=UPI003CF5E9E9
MTVQAGDPGPVIERLIRIETKQDVALQQSADHEGRIRALEQDNTPGGHQDHEGRIRRLERAVWISAGLAAAGGGVVGQLVAPLIGG